MIPLVEIHEGIIRTALDLFQFSALFFQGVIHSCSFTALAIQRYLQKLQFWVSKLKVHEKIWSTKNCLKKYNVHSRNNVIQRNLTCCWVSSVFVFALRFMQAACTERMTRLHSCRAAFSSLSFAFLISKITRNYSLETQVFYLTK